MKALKTVKMSLEVKGLLISDLDEQFFRYLHAVKISTYDRIKRDVFHGYSLKTVKNRVRNMEKSGLLTSYKSTALEDGKKMVMLTKKGFNAFVRMGGERRVELKSDSISHDLGLVDIRHKLMRQKKVKQYFTENKLQTWGYGLDKGQYSDFVGLRSDALLEVNAPKGLLYIPVEYEASRKIKSKYVSFVDKYYSREDVPLILLIYQDNRIRTIIEEIEKKRVKFSRFKRYKFFYSAMSNFMKDEALGIGSIKHISGDLPIYPW